MQLWDISDKNHAMFLESKPCRCQGGGLAVKSQGSLDKIVRYVDAWLLEQEDTPAGI